MSDQYDPSSVEQKWQQKWEEAKVYQTDLQNSKKPYYTHVMYPYPSGDKLHVGHWYNYGPADCHARFRRMQGFDVFSPMGFDAFGLPAENYAIKTGVPPAESTAANVETMITQLKRIGCMYDWSRSVNSSHPEYYKWTQWLFLQMYKNKLAYRKKGNVNHCPGCQTVLANEQVWEGKCERCDSEVVQKPLKQWYWKITDYADRLLAGFENLDWPEKTKIMQKNWIGRKEGIDIAYDVQGAAETITCFTTRPDTNFGATFLTIAPEHEFAQKISSGALPSSEKDAVSAYIEKARGKTERDRQEEGRTKTGAFTGFVAVNHLTGREMPIWISDFVLSGFGTGAVVGVPGHDKRDFEFAQAFDLPIIRVVVASDGDDSDITSIDQVQEEQGAMVNSEFLNGLDIHEAKEKIKDHMEKEGWGKRIVSYRLRDWLVSRQRYWGAPIPIVYDPDGNIHPIPEEHLPWLLPTDVAFTSDRAATLADSKELKERTEKIFGKGWTPEVDTMDTFVCSSYYSNLFLASSHESGAYKQRDLSTGSPVDPAIEKAWMPVDCYIGGAEHSCMHLIYARFVQMALKDFGFVSHEEPYKRLVHQGIITNQGAKMSKSKGNVVSPDEFVETYGSDAFRMYLMFMGPFTEGGDWSDSGIKGIDRFTKKIWTAVLEIAEANRKEETKAVAVALHATIKKVGEDLEALKFNTALAALMEFMNLARKEGGATVQTAKTLVLLLGPLAPHLAEELWERLGGKGFVIDQNWPMYEEDLLVSDTLTIAVQVNGKVRGEITISADAKESEVLSLAKSNEQVAKYLEGNKTKKEIYVSGRLVSFVV